MKKFTLATFLVSLFMPLSLFAQTTSNTNAPLFAKPLAQGESSDAVKDLQTILKTDPSIYPGGQVTGYYGPLTAEAVRKLQAKYGLPQTGILDTATQQVIYPTNTQIDLTVISPNGGETWDKNEVHTILWKSSVGPVVYNDRQLLPATSAAPTASGGTSNTGIAVPVRPTIAPFFPQASLDLVSDTNPNQYHIATVNLYDSQYMWKIPARIPAGSGYRIRLSIGANVPCLYRMEKQMTPDMVPPVCPMPMGMYYPSFYSEDQSDAPFTITGTTPPAPEVIEKLKSQVMDMQNTLQRLLEQLKSMQALLESL